MTEYDRHVEIKTLLTEIRDRLPEPEATKDENTRFTNDLGTMTVSEDCGGDLNFRIHRNSGFASLNPHEVIRLLKVMQERADSYPNTLDRDVRREVEQEAAEGRIDALEALAVEQQRRAEKAELDRDSATARAESWHRQFEKEKARAERAQAKHAALRVDVDGLRRNPETLTRLLMRIADVLDRDARTPTEGEKR